MELNEATVSKKTIFNGEVLNLEKLTVQMPDGRLATREVVRHPGASMIIPITEDNCVLMVRQFRKPVEKVCLEMPAGKLDKGEQPIDCARRELEEETGFCSENIKHIISIQTTPGFSDEVIHIYVATELKKGHLKPDKDEFLEMEKIKINELIKLIYQGNIKDAKTIIGAFIAERIINGSNKKFSIN